MNVLNHDSESTTLRYIGWDQEIIDDAMERIEELYNL